MIRRAAPAQMKRAATLGISSSDDRGHWSLSGACNKHLWLFDSTDVGDHLIARDYCERCPIRNACHDAFEAAREALAGVHCGGPEGTWAGILYGVRSTPLKVKLGTCLDCKNQMVPTDASRVFGYVRHEARGYCVTCYPRHRRAS